MHFSCNHLNFSLPEPEKCCNFPDLFPDETVDKCEKKFGLNISSTNNELLGDNVTKSQYLKIKIELFSFSA